MPLFNIHGALFVKQTREFEGLLDMFSFDDSGDYGRGRINVFHQMEATITYPAKIAVDQRFIP